MPVCWMYTYFWHRKECMYVSAHIQYLQKNDLRVECTITKAQVTANPSSLCWDIRLLLAPDSEANSSSPLSSPPLTWPEEGRTAGMNKRMREQREERGRRRMKKGWLNGREGWRCRRCTQTGRDLNGGRDRVENEWLSCPPARLPWGEWTGDADTAHKHPRRHENLGSHSSQ